MIENDWSYKQYEDTFKALRIANNLVEENKASVE